VRIVDVCPASKAVSIVGMCPASKGEGCVLNDTASDCHAVYVSGFEKRAHFTQNAKIVRFSTYRNLKTPRA